MDIKKPLPKPPAPIKKRISQDDTKLIPTTESMTTVASSTSTAATFKNVDRPIPIKPKPSVANSYD